MQDRFFQFRWQHPIISSMLAVLVIFILCLFNYWLFKTLFDRSYFAWYINTGPVFGLVSVVVAAAWERLDEHKGLVSPNPYEFMGSYSQLAGVAMYALVPLLEPKSYPKGPPYPDYAIGIFTALLLMFTILAWLIFVIPLQYFVFFVCGALPRLATHSSMRIVAWLTGHRSNHLETAEQSVDDDIPNNGWVATITDKPFKMTGAISTAFLFLLSQFFNF
jgi:hypothetical protein